MFDMRGGDGGWRLLGEILRFGTVTWMQIIKLQLKPQQLQRQKTNMAAQESATKQDNSEDNISDIIMIQASKNSFRLSGID